MKNKQNRRAFLQTSAGALAVGLSPLELDALRVNAKAGAAAPEANSTQIAQSVPSNEGKKPLRLGLIISIGKDPDAAMAKVRDLGLPTCQAYVEDFELEQAGRLRQALDKHGIEATSLVVG